MTRSQANLAKALQRIPVGWKFTVNKLAEKAKLTPSSVRRSLPGLVEAGLVEVLKKGRSGSGGTGSYRRLA